MSEQSRLENIAIAKRDSLEIMNDFQNLPGRVYDETHEDAISNGDKDGKGNGVSLGYAIPDPNAFNISPTGTISQKINYGSIITHENGNSTIGGEYDRKGNPSISKSGREGLATINKYRPGAEYSINTIDMTANLKEGQYKDIRH